MEEPEKVKKIILNSLRVSLDVEEDEYNWSFFSDWLYERNLIPKMIAANIEIRKMVWDAFEEGAIYGYAKGRLKH